MKNDQEVSAKEQIFINCKKKMNTEKRLKNVAVLP